MLSLSLPQIVLRSGKQTLRRDVATAWWRVGWRKTNPTAFRLTNALTLTIAVKYLRLGVVRHSFSVEPRGLMSLGTRLLSGGATYPLPEPLNQSCALSNHSISRVSRVLQGRAEVKIRFTWSDFLLACLGNPSCKRIDPGMMMEIAPHSISCAFYAGKAEMQRSCLMLLVQPAIHKFL